jgi:hypothetical protein
MAEDRIGSFKEFWPYYIGEHRSPVCRTLHYFGTFLGTSTAIWAAVTQNAWLVPLALVLGYGPAWVGHFFIEHNRPATFKYPLWSLASDYKMLALALTGKINDEVTRLYGSPNPPPDAPRRAET